MPLSIDSILDVLAAHDILPLETEEADLPGIGRIEEGESVYSTSVAEVFGGDEDMDGSPRDTIYRNPSDSDDPRIRDWWSLIGQIMNDPGQRVVHRARRRVLGAPPPEPSCAWYCPIHFYGHSWGIYIREGCILSLALDIAAEVDWRSTLLPPGPIMQHLLRSAFYALFLHEQFHHKVESLGFRLLVSTGSDRYRPYKRNVYRPNYLTSHCLEESLANSESIRRLNESRYLDRLHPGIRAGLRAYLRAAIPLQPAGYAEGVNYVSDQAYRDGLYRLQSQVLDGSLVSATQPSHWTAAPNMITSLADITEEIYVILPRGARPTFNATWIDPRVTVSTRDLQTALIRHHGYQSVPGGKGSHVKLAKPGAPTIILPGNRPVLSPGVIGHVLKALGGYPTSRLSDLLAGRLAPAQAELL